MSQQRTLWGSSGTASSFEWRALPAALLTITLWASAFAGIRAGMQSYSPASVALLRYLTASLVLGLYALITKMSWVRWRDVPGIAIS